MGRIEKAGVVAGLAVAILCVTRLAWIGGTWLASSRSFSLATDLTSQAAPVIVIGLAAVLYASLVAVLTDGRSGRD